MKNEKKDKQLHYNQLETTAHNDRLNRFNAKQGHGYAAEQGNYLYDTILGRDAKILGDDNAKDGADRMVDGKLIQTKYCQTARASVDAGFKNGKYRYVDGNGNPMQLEVPSDQYEEAVRIMAKKIEEGKVPNCNDPKKAPELVRKGNLTLKQAMNIAKAGTVESITFDAIHGVVIGTSAAGISATIVFARALWNGEDVDEALDLAVYTGLEAGGMAFLTSLVSAQLTKTSLNTVLLKPSAELVKLLPSTIRKNLLTVMRNGAPIYGAAASKNLAKLLRTNAIVQVVSLIALSSNDIFNYANGKISGKQLFKEAVTIASSLVGTAGGGSFLGTLAIPFGPIATIVASIVGGIAGGSLSTSITRELLDQFIEDDAIALIKIINDRFSILAVNYLLNQEEVEIVTEVLRGCLVHNKLLEMFASDDRIHFADELLSTCIENVIEWRTFIRMPSQNIMTESAGRVITKIEEHTFTLDSTNNISAQELAKQLLGRETSELAAKKALYVTKQFHARNIQGRSLLQGIKYDMQTNDKAFNKVNQNVGAMNIQIDNLLSLAKERTYGK